MPKFAHLSERVPCPQCGSDLAWEGRVAFQWGYCDHPYSGTTGRSYRVGDALTWRATADGQVLEWRYFRDGGGNIGEPQPDVLVRENEFDIGLCRACDWEFGAIGVTIRSGAIESVRPYVDWPKDVDVLEFDSDGELIPRPDWTDHPMGFEPR